MATPARIVVITGAGKGIGRATCLAFADEGATVIGVARSNSDLDETGRLIAERGAGNFVPVVADLAQEAGILAIFEQIDGSFGGHIDVLVNNAGAGEPAPLANTTTEAWDAQFAVNVRATFLMSREYARRMLPRRAGCIVNISSLAGVRGVPGFSAYSASKFAAVGFTQAIGRELRKSGIRTHLICPGAVATELRAKAAPNEDPRTITQPEDVAALVVLLAGARDAPISDLSFETY